MQSPHESSVEAENVILKRWAEVRGQVQAGALWNAAGEVLRTFAEIEQEHQQLVLRFEGLERGTVVAVQVGNHPSWPAIVLALWSRGLVPLPLGRHMEAAELAGALATCAAGALITCAGDEVILERLGRHPPWGASEPPALLKLTSGTTSAPRAVRFRATQLLADCENICESMGLLASDLNYGVIPISHSYGFSNLLLPLLCRGVPMALSDDRMPRAILQGLAASGATVFPGMPVFYDKLASLEPGLALPRLRLCISAGAPLTPTVAERFTQRFGLEIHTFYGSSECGGIGYDRSAQVRYKEGYVGSPMAHVQIEPLPGGRIAIRGPAVGEGYFPEPEPAALGDGQFIPGDLVEWRDGSMYLAGRASDLINIAGRKLNPAEVEAQLAACPGVRQAVVFGIPSRLRGEEPVACVAGEGLARAELQRFCHERLSPWQRPRDFWIVPEIEVSERGKISRREMARRYLALQA